MKIKKYIIALFLLFIVMLIPVNGSTLEDKDTIQKQKNFIIENKDLETALNNGCKISKNFKHIKVVQCNTDIASSLNLLEDIEGGVMDIGANSQVHADLVQNNGFTGTGRKIVVLDSGYDYNHVELSSSYLGGYDFINDDSDPIDDHGHGSFVAGLITADGVDPYAKGIAPNAGIISGKIVNNLGRGYLSTVIEGIYWAVNGNDGIYGTSDDFKADAISISFGTDPPFVYNGYCDGVYPPLTEAIRYARSKGVPVVISSGNYGTQGVSIPGCISYSTTVGAVDSSNVISEISSRGTSVDFVAPGVDIYSTWKDNGYYTGTGTSASTPLVSGTIALIKSRHPGYSLSQVETSLTRTVKDLGVSGKDNNYGYGLIDAYKAVYYQFTSKKLPRRA